jgi:hypothetical protein
LLEAILRLVQLKRFAVSSEKMPCQFDFIDEAGSGRVVEYW